MCAVFFIVLFVVVHSLPLCDMTQPNEYNDGKWILLDKIANSTTRFESSLKDTPILCKKVLRQSQQARVCAHHVDTVLPMEFFPRVRIFFKKQNKSNFTLFLCCLQTTEL